MLYGISRSAQMRSRTSATIEAGSFPAFCRLRWRQSRLFKWSPEDDASNAAARRKRHFKGITLGMTCYGAQHRQSGLFVISALRKDYREPPFCLRPTSLRREIEPHKVAGMRHIFVRYHNSFLTGSPQSVLPWGLKAQMLSRERQAGWSDRQRPLCGGRYPE
jgi:hypothetical protein